MEAFGLPTKPNIMKNYQLNIIKEYVSTALISDDPQEHLVNGIAKLIEAYEEETDEAIEYLFEAEKQIPLRR